MSKITRATVKSFVKKNADKLLISTVSDFDGQVDGLVRCADQSFGSAVKADYFHDNNLGIHGIWLVSGSRNYFTEYSKQGLIGIEVSNCCGSFIVAIKE